MNKLKKSKTSKRSKPTDNETNEILHTSKKLKMNDCNNFDEDNDNNFNTCLMKSNNTKTVIDLVDDNSIHTGAWLCRQSSSYNLSDTSWLSSTQIEVVVAHFARCYPATTFLSPDFAAFDISNGPKHSDIDVLGNFIHPNTNTTNSNNYSNEHKHGIEHGIEHESDQHRNPIVCVFNSRDIHWNIVRINFYPVRNLQLFEPMGKPVSRRVKPVTTMSYRDIPATLIKWLDSRWPMEKKQSWLTVGTSVITTQQQYTTYDCGVACLLYAEKCAVGQV